MGQVAEWVAGNPARLASEARQSCGTEPCNVWELTLTPSSVRREPLDTQLVLGKESGVRRQQTVSKAEGKAV